MRHILISIITTIIIIGCEEEANEVKKISSANAESVYLTHDNNDNPVIAWTEKTEDRVDFLFAVSKDDGKTFSQRVSVPLCQNVATHAEGMPKVAYKKDGTIYIGYEKKLPTATNKYAGSIYYITSVDNGKTWAKEKYMHEDTVSGGSRSYFDIETLPDGEIGAAWLDIKLNQETGGRSVRFAKTNASNSFVDEMLIDSSACQCCRIEVYTDVNKNVYVAYRGLRKGSMGRSIRDMMITTSSDHGTSFTSPITISSDNWNIDGCPHTGPSLCSNKAGLFTMWYTEGSGTGVFYAHKENIDDNFLPREAVSTNGRHPQVSSNGELIAMLWEENIQSGGKSMTTVNYRLIKEGVDLKKDILTAKDVNAFLPVVTQTRDGFLVAYLMEVNNQVGVYLTQL
jgi:hypothetical protein